MLWFKKNNNCKDLKLYYYLTITDGFILLYFQVIKTSLSYLYNCTIKTYHHRSMVCSIYLKVNNNDMFDVFLQKLVKHAVLLIEE